jgi:hypothetical protein
MAENRKKKQKGASKLSRRGVLGNAAAIVGAAASTVTARSALAQPEDVSLDSSGKPLIGGRDVKMRAKYSKTAAAGDQNCGCGLTRTKPKGAVKKPPSSQSK